MIRTKEGLEPPLVTATEHSQAGQVPDTVEHALQRKKKRHKKTVTEEDAATKEDTSQAGQVPVLEESPPTPLKEEDERSLTSWTGPSIS